MPMIAFASALKLRDALSHLSPQVGERRRLALMVVNMAMVSITSVGVALYLLYGTVMQEQRHRLSDLARSQARFIEVVVENGIGSEAPGSQGSDVEAVLEQVRTADAQFVRAEENIELVLARHEGDHINFLVSRYDDRNLADTISLETDWAEPMRLALSGESGTGVGLDYRGEKVLAAYEPVILPDGNRLGLVCKVDMHEVQAPFIKAAALSGAGALGVIALGTALFWVVSHPLITELSMSEERFRLAFETSPHGMALVSTNGKWLAVNDAFTQIAGYTEEELLEIDFQQITHPDDLQNDLDHFRRMLTGETDRYSTEKRYFHKNGYVIWVQLSASLVKDSRGKPVYFVSQFHDITRRKHAEAERELLIHELAAKNVELEQFAYTLSHDLKSPLITIAGFMGYMEKDIEQGNQQRIAKNMLRINQAIEKMRVLMDEMLERSRQGKLINDLRPISLTEAARQAAGLVAGQISARKVRLEIAPNLPTVMADPIRLREVFQNLIDNAVKYMGDQPEPKISVGIRQGNNGKVTCFVQDNGIGVDKNAREEIFGLFERSSQKDGSGEGIGLALVRRIVEAHHGRIWVESEGAGLGSRFYFTLPAGQGS